MSLSLTIVSILFSLFIIIFVVFLLRKGSISIKYSLIWLILFLILLIVAIIPGFMAWITNLLGFKAASNMAVSLILGVQVIITIALTVIVSNQDKKIRLLIQEISLLKGKYEKK